jgi:glycosyltransferase involved in cell wall biosynthesis
MIFRKLHIIGGSQRHALNIAIKLKEMGHEVTLYATQKGSGGFTDIINVFPVVYLESYHAPVYDAGNPIKQFFYFFLNTRNEEKDAYSLAMLIDPKTDILNPHHNTITYKVAYYFKRYAHNIPSVWTMNDLTTRNFLYMREQEVNPGWKPSRIARLCNWIADYYEIKKFISSQDGISVLDNRDEQWTKKYFGKESTVVRSAIEIVNFPYQTRVLAPRNNAVKLLALGIFFAHRRFEDIIEAMALVRDQKQIICWLDIIGKYEEKDPYYRRIRNCVREHGVESHVRFWGEISEGDLLTHRQNHDIFLFPSHLQSWGIAVFESMACGTPVIVSRTAGASEILSNGDTALLVNPKDPQEIADAIVRLVEEPELYFHLSVEGRNFVEHTMSWEKSARELLALFEREIMLYQQL